MSTGTNFFQVNLPGEPAVTEVPYHTVKGTNLTARVFTATADPSSITAGTYKVTVVDYTSAQNELRRRDRTGAASDPRQGHREV